MYTIAIDQDQLDVLRGSFDYALENLRFKPAKNIDYTFIEIELSEENRVRLVADLTASGLGGDEGNFDTPMLYWISMLNDLPTEEAENPGIIHGFCF